MTLSGLGDGVESNRPATNIPGIPVDSDRFDCLVENSGLDVAPRRVENPIKQGESQEALASQHVSLGLRSRRSWLFARYDKSGRHPAEDQASRPHFVRPGRPRYRERL